MTTIGTLGARWRGSVRPWGAVEARGHLVDWWVAADDRWHTPRTEASLRQRLVRGTPVVETIIRVPGGDAIHRAYGVPDGGGLVVIEVENASPLPFVVAFDRSDLLFARAPSAQPPSGIELPAGSVVLPVGHRSTVRLAMAVAARGPAQLPPGLPGGEQVARGWEAQAGRGVRIEGLDDELAIALTEARCRLLLDGPPVSGGDSVGMAPERGRAACGSERTPRRGPRRSPRGRCGWRSRRGADPGSGWEHAAALDAAAEVLARAGEELGASDVTRLAATMAPAGGLPDDVPVDPARRAAWVLRRVLRPTHGGAELLPEPLASWRGRNLAVYGVWAGGGQVSFAVRWHGERPALLWEAPEGLTLRAPALDPTWSTTAATGEALLGPPPPPSRAR